MKTKIILLASAAILMISCNQKKEKASSNLLAINTIEIEMVSPPLQKEAYMLMKNNCYACHNPNTESHETIIAPPFRAVKMHYTRTYDTKQEFVTAVVDWVQNPSKEKALMRGAVNKFNLMPMLPLGTKDLEKIAAYIYDNDVDQPKWMDSHMKEEHGKGKGKGKMKKNN